MIFHLIILLIDQGKVGKKIRNLSGINIVVAVSEFLGHRLRDFA